MSAKIIANRIQNIKPSATMSVSMKAAELIAAGHKIIRLSTGEPDFDTPEYIKEQAINAINNGETKYTAVDGTVKLKQAIADKFAKDNDLYYELNNILVSCGGKQSIFNLMQTIISAGDEVLIPAPYWVSYPDMAILADGIPKIINSDIENKFKINANQLEESITAKTKLFIINSPSNPSGQSYSKEELEQFAAVLRKHPHVYILSDDLYEHIRFDNQNFYNIAMVAPDLKERIIIVNGVSKAYAMTGWRIGYAAGNTEIIKNMKKLQSQSTSNPCSISQTAAVAALTHDKEYVNKMVAAFNKRHELIITEINKTQYLKAIPSNGTFYSFFSVKELIQAHNDKFDNDIDIANFFLTEANVALVPGSAFGTPGYMRLSFASSEEDLQTALQSIKNSIAKLN